MKINKNIIKELSDYLDEFNLTEIEYTEKDLKVKVSKTNGISSTPVITNTEKQEIERAENTSSETSGTKITSPIIGDEIFVPLISGDLFSVFSISCFEVFFITGVEFISFVFETLTFKSFSVYSISVRLNSSK